MITDSKSPDELLADAHTQLRSAIAAAEAAEDIVGRANDAHLVAQHALRLHRESQDTREARASQSQYAALRAGAAVNGVTDDDQTAAAEMLKLEARIRIAAGVLERAKSERDASSQAVKSAKASATAAARSVLAAEAARKAERHRELSRELREVDADLKGLEVHRIKVPAGPYSNWTHLTIDQLQAQNNEAWDSGAISNLAFAKAIAKYERRLAELVAGSPNLGM